MLSQAELSVETPDCKSSGELTGAPPPEPWAPSRRLLPAAIALSFLLHVAGAAAMLVSRGDTDEQGLSENTSDAISIERVHTLVVESIAIKPTEELTAASSEAIQAGAAPSVDVKAKPVVEEATKPELEIEPEPEVKPVKTTALEPNDIEPQDDPLLVVGGSADPVEAVEAIPVEDAPEEEAEPEKRKRERAQEVAMSSQRQVAGGATSRSSAAQDEVAAPASASRGSIINYARRARAKINRYRPPGKGRRGVVQISFGLSATGELEYAQLKKSSGNAKLDEAAVAAVRNAAPFDPPPPGSRPEQLRFSIPFYFR